MVRFVTIQARFGFYQVCFGYYRYPIVTAHCYIRWGLLGVMFALQCNYSKSVWLWSSHVRIATRLRSSSDLIGVFILLGVLLTMQRISMCCRNRRSAIVSVSLKPIHWLAQVGIPMELPRCIDKRWTLIFSGKVFPTYPVTIPKRTNFNQNVSSYPFYSLIRSRTSIYLPNSIANNASNINVYVGFTARPFRLT